MKKVFITTALVLLTFGVSRMWANVITVSNNTINAGQYTSLQTALDNSLVDDTIYVHGSPNDYGNSTVYVKRRVTIIGAGYAPVGTQYNWKTTISYISLDSVPFTDPISGTKIIGVDGYSLNSDAGINDVVVERTQIDYIYVEGDGWMIHNNITYGIDCGNHSNLYIDNNLLGYVNYSNSVSVVISNNIFSLYSWDAFYSMTNALITNNIFWYCTATNGTSACTFNKNITMNSSSQILPPAGNSGSGNLNNTNPQFMDTSIPTSSVSTSSAPGYDWHLKNTSPGKNAGTDGSDIGIYGGTYPAPNLTGASRIPQMTLMNIGNAVVPQGGNLNVNFKARKQN